MEMAEAFFVKSSWSLSSALDDYEKHWSVSEGSIPSYRSVRRSLVEPYLDDRPISSFDSYDIIEWRDALVDSDRAASYVNKALAYLSGAFSYFVTAYGLADNPVKGVGRVREDFKEAPYFDEGDFSRLERLLVSGMADESTSKENVELRMTCFAAYTSLHFGLRCGEVCALTRDDISITNEMIVRHNLVGNCGAPHIGPTKGRRARKFSCDDRQWREQYDRHLAFHKAWRGIPLSRGEPLITFTGDWTRPGEVSARFSELRDLWGLPEDTHFHTLRHTHATYSLGYLRQQPDMVSRRLGHADVATTLRIYVHAIPAQDAQAAQDFGSMAKRLSEGL
ncbi:MAG: tyrosine-type recombinase/integrase [Bacteroidales bacterium]|nr:tyrosine-type recombinase/integrase [Candidatus Colimorpha merdihippi]